MLFIGVCILLFALNKLNIYEYMVENVFAVEVELDTYVEENQQNEYEDNDTTDIITINDYNNMGESNLINTHNVTYQSEDYVENSSSSSNVVTEHNFSDYSTFSSLKNNYYTVDNRAGINEAFFDADKFMSADTSIDNDKKSPKVLIFHTHGGEIYKDSKDASEGVIGLGEELKKILDQNNIKTIHDTTRYDLVDGQTQIIGAYERMEVNIQKILDENPTIEVVIDIHRDGVPDDTILTTTVNGQDMAEIMFVNGLSSLNVNGQAQSIQDLPNKNLEENLAFSFKMKTIGDDMYSGLFRKIYLHAYRYSLHMKGKSLLVEVGAQTNTYKEALSSMKPLADVLIQTIE